MIRGAFYVLLAGISISTTGQITGAEPQLPAFPGAEGFGATTPGGRGGQVLRVTTLADYGRKDDPIPGSLRAAVQTRGPRTIVFRVGGTIELKESLRITEPYITIAGQTAPGDGVCLKNYDVGIRDTHDVVIRYLRVRPGDVAGKPLDAMYVYGCQNVIIDHCSASWGSDETLSVTGEGCTDVTVQWCYLTESLNQSVHEKGAHGYGSLIRTDGDITYHHNLYAHHKTRCPRPGTYGDPRGILLDFRNNVIYNWMSPAGYTAEDKATMNYVGNYLKPGPNTTARRRAFEVEGQATTLYVEGNYIEGAGAANDNQRRLIEDAERATWARNEFDVAPITSHAAAEAYRLVLEHGGASCLARDSVDTRIVSEVQSGTGRIINSQADVGEWPVYRSGTPSHDTDRDGMPDDWEEQHGLNPNDGSDHRLDRNDDGYTNLEEYLNDIVIRCD
jgi:pectate lyase